MQGSRHYGMPSLTGHYPDFRPLMQHGVLMGQEANPDHFNSTPTGIANGIIVSPPRSSFLVSQTRSFVHHF